jgi:hypothetical protein
VDYFLFDLQQGYCNYYATAMVVLARAAGLPARLVTGFRTGSYDYANDWFIVRQENSHAWVEVYFAGFGWVEFEPTSGVPLLPRTGGLQEAALAPQVLPPKVEQPPITRLYWAALRNPLTVLGILLAGVLLLCLLPIRDWVLYLHPVDKAVQVIYRRIYRQGRRWGIPPDAARTPHEFSLALVSRLERITASQRMAPLVLLLREDLSDLTLLYTRLLFSPYQPERSDQLRAIRTWMRLRRGLQRMRAKDRFRPARTHMTER